MNELKVSVKKPIPNKLFFKIGEVAELTELEPYILRYWEMEFNFRLGKSKNKQRLYQRKNIDQILLVKKLLYQDKYTIKGAKQKLKELRREHKDKQLSLIYDTPQGLEAMPDEQQDHRKRLLRSLKTELEDLKTQLRRLGHL